MTRILSILIIMLMFSANPGQARGADLIQPISDGEIDWSLGVITAQGADMNAARQNLWQVVKGIRLDNQRLVGELISRNTGLKEQLQRLIQRAETIARGESSGVRLQLSLRGLFTEAILAVLPVGNSNRLPGRHGPPAHNPAPSGPAFKQGPSGLVVDARGLGVEPALAPHILSEDGREIYGLDKVSRSYAVHQSLVVYMRDVAQAKTSLRVINDPIVIRALRVDPETTTDLVISDKDAERVNQASKQYDFLHKCRVIIVVEEPRP